MTQQTFKWQRPSFNPDTLGRGSCQRCGQSALYEYTETGQHEPDKYAIWTPLCFDHHQPEDDTDELRLDRIDPS